MELEATTEGTGFRPLDVAASFHTIVQRRFRLWLAAGLIIFVGLTYNALYRKKQPIESTASVAIEQRTDSDLALSLLSGASPGSTRYMGLLGSRRLAEEVEKDVHLHEILHQPRNLVVSRLMLKWLDLNDDAGKGLLFITVRLDGPPILAKFKASERAELRMASAAAANAYASVLQRYYVTTDNDRDDVLRRGAEDVLRQEKGEFKRSVERLRDFIRAQRGAYPRIQPDVDEAASGGRLPEGEVARLNASLDQMESEIRSMEAQMETSDRLVDSQVANLSVLPAEDPLLKDARQAVTDASITVMNLEIQFGDDYPRVIEARARLKIAEERLKQEASGVRKRLTTPQVQAYADLVSVRAKRDELRGQLRDAAARLPLSRDLALQLALLRNEMDAQRQLLQVVLQETLKIRIQTVPGQSHVLIVDKAIPAEKVTPLEAMLAIVLSVAKVLAMTVTLIIAAAALEICYAAGDLLDR